MHYLPTTYTSPLSVLHKQHLACVCLMDPGSIHRSIHPSHDGWVTLQAIPGAPGTLYLQERQLPGTCRSRALDSGVAVPEPKRDPFLIHPRPPNPCIVIHGVEGRKVCHPLAEDPEKKTQRERHMRPSLPVLSMDGAHHPSLFKGR